MEYLKAFMIGSSGLVTLQHLYPLALTDKNYYSYSFELYSLWLPFHYGLWTIIAILLHKKLKLSLELSLFIVSILSLVSTSYCNYSTEYCNKYNKKLCEKDNKYCKENIKPYNTFNTNDWIKYLFRIGSRHIICFNLIIYYLYKYYSSNYWLKVFIIGNSIFSYYIVYLMVLRVKNKINYSYEYFTVTEPLVLGIKLVIFLFILQVIFKLDLKTSLFVQFIISNFIMLYMAHNSKTYKYEGNEWLGYLSRGILSGFIKIIIIYYLIIKIK